jgi:glycolate oxidase iron-sulfur subunit
MNKESDMTEHNRDLLREVRDIVIQCDRCGTCLTVCPLFGVKDVEASSARGKNILARAVVEGGFAADGGCSKDELLSAVPHCIDNCPSKVKTDGAMIALRQ